MAVIISRTNNQLFKLLVALFGVVTFFSILSVQFAPDFIIALVDVIHIKVLLFLVWETLILMFCIFYYYASYRCHPIDLYLYIMKLNFIAFWLYVIWPHLGFAIKTVNYKLGKSSVDVQMQNNQDWPSLLIIFISLLVFSLIYSYVYKHMPEEDV